MQLIYSKRHFHRYLYSGVQREVFIPLMPEEFDDSLKDRRQTRDRQTQNLGVLYGQVMQTPSSDTKDLPKLYTAQQNPNKT